MEYYITRKNKKYNLKKIFGYYFLPFSINEKFMLFNFLLIYPFSLFGLYKYTENIFFSILYLAPTFILIIIFYRRFFTEIQTHLSLEENISVIEDIKSRQTSSFISNEYIGLYLFEISMKRDKETIVIICEEEAIYINSYFQRKLYNFFSKNIKSLKHLIIIKVNSYNNYRIEK